MSLQSWKEEFYPIPAREVAADAALDHSIQKWKGALPENRDLHDVSYNLYCIESNCSVFPFRFNSDSCALCYRHLKLDRLDRTADSCTSCPIFKVTGKTCDGPDAAWHQSAFNPAPMIALLEHVRANLPIP